MIGGGGIIIVIIIIKVKFAVFWSYAAVMV